LAVLSQLTVRSFARLERECGRFRTFSYVKSATNLNTSMYLPVLIGLTGALCPVPYHAAWDRQSGDSEKGREERKG
jgi:hypothetical protein